MVRFSKTITYFLYTATLSAGCGGINQNVQPAAIAEHKLVFNQALQHMIDSTIQRQFYTYTLHYDDMVYLDVK